MSADEVGCVPLEAWLAHFGKHLLDSNPEELVELQVEVAADGHQQIVHAAQLCCQSLLIVPSRAHIGLWSMRAIWDHFQDLRPGAGLPDLQDMKHNAQSEPAGSRETHHSRSDGGIGSQECCDPGCKIIWGEKESICNGQHWLPLAR